MNSILERLSAIEQELGMNVESKSGTPTVYMPIYARLNQAETDIKITRNEVFGISEPGTATIGGLRACCQTAEAYKGQSR